MVGTERQDLVVESAVNSNSRKTELRRGRVVEYYEQLAASYDHDRFGNSYGAYLHAQERRILRQWLLPHSRGQILDLACGTGRLLDLATHGLDASETMVRIARTKYPGKRVHCGPATEMARAGVRFDAIFCLHFFMHLSQPEIESLMKTVQDHLRTGGFFIFDVPTAFRRNLTGFQPDGWHAGTALSPVEVCALAESGWRLWRTRGVLFFPIHRLPSWGRRALRPLDDLIGITPLKALSSYTLYCLERTA